MNIIDSFNNSWSSYPKVWSLGKLETQKIFDNEVTIEEKIDGSQFSFGVFNGELKFRSKGKELDVRAPEKMFLPAIQSVESFKERLKSGFTYRCEFLSKPQHNTILYSRVPKGNLVLFDINPPDSSFISYNAKQIVADALGIDCVPLFFQGKVNSIEELMIFMEKESFLGGAKIEGFVVKNYELKMKDGHPTFGKYVGEAFKESNSAIWSSKNQCQSTIIDKLIKKYESNARLKKCIQHLTESGELTESPKDIPILMREFKDDMVKETESEIKQLLYEWAIDKVSRGCTRFIPNAYKDYLLTKCFNSGNDEPKTNGKTNGSEIK